MKKSLSRVLALVLTLVLLVGSVPFVAATETETTIKLNTTSLNMNPLDTYTLTATTDPSSLSKSVKWSSSDEGVARVSSAGKVTAKAPGFCTITATVNDVSAECEVFVRKLPVIINKDDITLDKGETEQLKITISGLTEGKSFEVSWKSDDTKIATVSSKGVVTGKKVGTTTITATISPEGNYEKAHFETTTLYCDVEVTDDTRINVPKTVSVEAGSSKKITASLTGGDSDYSKEEFSFEIDDTDIITESKNSTTDTSITIKGKNPGTTTLTVSLEEAEDDDKNDVTGVEDEVIRVYVYEEVDIEVILQDGVDEFDFEEDDVFEEAYINGDEVDDPEDVTLADLLTDALGGITSSRYITFEHSTSSNSSGELYIDPTKTNTTKDSITVNNLQYVEFTMGKNGSEKIGYEINTGDDEEKIAYGIITVRTEAGGDVVYEAEEGESIQLSEEDFEEFWDMVSESNSEKLDYIKFTSIPAAGNTYGTLYTTSAKTTKASTSMKFYLDYISGTGYDLDALYYVPGTNTDTVEYEFTAYGTKSNDYDGTLTIIVGGEKGDIVYKMDKNDDNVIFDEDDFIDFWEDKRDDDDEDLEYVIFTDEPASGTLYVNDDEDDEVDDEMEFYTTDFSNSSDDELDDVCYVPAKSPKSTEIPFTAYGEDGSKEKGTVYIQYGDETTASDKITSRGVVFGKNGIDEDIADFYEDETDEELEYVTFELPSASEGKLYYNFSKVLTTDKVSEKDEFYLEPGSKDLDLAKVCFIPAAGKTGKVTIEFTAYGDGDEEEGEITLNIEAKTASAKFTDVNSRSYSWAADGVDFLYYEGVVNGTNTANTMYSPANSITRGHFMLMIYRAFLEGDHSGDSISSNFDDIKKGSSDYDKELYQAVGVAKKLGIAKGSGNNFNPNSKITREEAMTLIYRTLQELDMDLEYSTSKTMSSFNDSSKVSSWATDGISYLIKHGVVVGSNGNISPKSNITRAEMAVILHRVLTY